VSSILTLGSRPSEWRFRVQEGCGPRRSSSSSSGSLRRCVDAGQVGLAQRLLIFWPRVPDQGRTSHRRTHRTLTERAAVKQGAGAAASRARAARPDQPPGYLAPNRSRRGYGDRFEAADALHRGSNQIGAPPTLAHALEVMLNADALDWLRTQLRNCRGYLLSTTPRRRLRGDNPAGESLPLQAFVRHRGIAPPDEPRSARPGPRSQRAPDDRGGLCAPQCRRWLRGRTEDADIRARR